jgi:hypothetical protein
VGLLVAGITEVTPLPTIQFLDAYAATTTDIISDPSILLGAFLVVVDAFPWDVALVNNLNGLPLSADAAIGDGG